MGRWSRGSSRSREAFVASGSEEAAGAGAVEVLDRVADSVEWVRRNAGTAGFDLDGTGRTTEERAELLDRLGIVTFPSGLPEEALGEIRDVLFRFASDVRAGRAPAGVAAFRRRNSGDDYRTMAESETAVVSVRGDDDDGVDAGMIDLFNVDRLLPDLGPALREAMLSVGTIELLELATGATVEDRNLNAYINESVTSTRGLHVDSYSRKQFKVFVYLTDVLSLDDGPYCYAPTSHRLEGMEEANRRLAGAFGLSHTDVRLCPPELPLPLLAPAGTIIVSDQGGAHRGFPQVPGSRRILGVLNCRITR
jgi:hypothetical protein